MPATYLVEQMKSFKSGTRPGTVMPQLAKGYSDAQNEEGFLGLAFEPADIALDDHEIQNVQRDRDVSTEDLGELPVVLVESRALPALDVEDADRAERTGRAVVAGRCRRPCAYCRTRR